MESDGKAPEDPDDEGSGDVDGKRDENAKRTRGPGRPFGQGNQAAKGHGRPALSSEYKAALKQLEPKALRALDEILEDVKHRDRRKAAEYVIDRRRGRPRVRAEITGAKGTPLVPPVESAALQALRRLMQPLGQEPAPALLPEQEQPDRPDPPKDE